jgi:hypothetical protein
MSGTVPEHSRHLLKSSFQCVNKRQCTREEQFLNIVILVFRLGAHKGILMRPLDRLTMTGRRGFRAGGLPLTTFTWLLIVSFWIHLSTL